MIGVYLLAALSLIGGMAPARADSPMPPPAVSQTSSPDGSFRAVADPRSDLLSVFRRGASTPLWTLRGWRRSFFLANDGEHLVIGPDGLNLLSVDVDEDSALLVFMHRTEQLRVVTVGQLFPGLRGLQRTVSHLAWGVILGVSSQNRLVVDLVDGRRIEFDVSSGKLQ
jgi:hypothetical protein